MSNARLLVLADKIAALANQALSNSYASLTDTSVDAEMSTVPLERKTEILAKELQKRFLLEGNIYRLTHLTETSPDSEIEFLRKEFNRLLNSNERSQPEFANVCYDILLALTEFKPINDTCLITLEVIQKENVIYTSDGYQFDRTQLPAYINQYGFKNGFTNQYFSDRDKALLNACIPGLNPLPLIQRENTSSTYDSIMFCLMLMLSAPFFMQLNFRSYYQHQHSGLWRPQFVDDDDDHVITPITLMRTTVTLALISYTNPFDNYSLNLAIKVALAAFLLPTISPFFKMAKEITLAVLFLPMTVTQILNRQGLFQAPRDEQQNNNNLRPRIREL
jgi:hypothetical protein